MLTSACWADEDGASANVDTPTDRFLRRVGPLWSTWWLREAEPVGDVCRNAVRRARGLPLKTGPNHRRGRCREPVQRYDRFGFCKSWQRAGTVAVPTAALAPAGPRPWHLSMEALEARLDGLEVANEQLRQGMRCSDSVPLSKPTPARHSHPARLHHVHLHHRPCHSLKPPSPSSNLLQESARRNCGSGTSSSEIGTPCSRSRSRRW